MVEYRFLLHNTEDYRKGKYWFFDRNNIIGYILQSELPSISYENDSNFVAIQKLGLVFVFQLRPLKIEFSLVYF